MGGSCSCHDFFAGGFRLAIGNVFSNRAKEEKRLLQHQANVAAEVCNAKAADVHTVELDRAFAHVIETANQVDQCALA